jgi:enoyl-CoA hydratase/carnithine racemase
VAVQYQTLRLTFEGSIARLGLARPADANRIDMRFLRELADASDAIDREEGVSLVVVSADGPDFCAGWDGPAREQLQKSADRLDPFGCLATLPLPVLALLHGTVASAGLELALACDLRVARDDAMFSVDDVAAGGVPLAGATARLPRIAGRTVAAGMLLLGQELDAEAAYRCGLVSRVFAGPAFDAETAALAARIVANGPLALRYAKEAVVNGIELPLEQALRYELDLSVILQTTRDRAEGVQAFLEKRRPSFEGR